MLHTGLQQVQPQASCSTCGAWQAVYRCTLGFEVNSMCAAVARSVCLCVFGRVCGLPHFVVGGSPCFLLTLD